MTFTDNVLIKVDAKIIAIRTTWYMRDPAGGKWETVAIDDVGEVYVFIPDWETPGPWQGLYSHIRMMSECGMDFSVFEYIPDPAVFDSWMFEREVDYDYRIFAPKDGKLFVQIENTVFSMSNYFFMKDPLNGRFTEYHVGNLGKTWVFEPYFTMSNYWHKVHAWIDKKAPVQGFAAGAYIDDILRGWKEITENTLLDVILGEHNLLMSAKVFLGDPRHGCWERGRCVGASDKPAFTATINSALGSPYWTEIADKVVAAKGEVYLQQKGPVELLDEILDPTAFYEHPSLNVITAYINEKYGDSWYVTDTGAVLCKQDGMTGKSAFAQGEPMYQYYVVDCVGKFYTRDEVLKRAEEQEALYTKLLGELKMCTEAKYARATLNLHVRSLRDAIEGNEQLTERQRADMLVDVCWVEASVREWISVNMM